MKLNALTCSITIAGLLFQYNEHIYIKQVIRKGDSDLRTETIKMKERKKHEPANQLYENLIVYACLP